MKIYVETSRLILREMLPTDIDGMFELDSDPLVHTYLGSKPVQTRENSAQMIEKVRQQYINQGIGRWAIVEKASGKFIGWSGLKLYFDMSFNGRSNFHDIGYRLIPRFWGKGYATEAALATLDYGFNILKLDAIVGLADVNNLASNTILKKIGLRYIEKFIYEDQDVNWYELKNFEYGEEMS